MATPPTQKFAPDEGELQRLLENFVTGNIDLQRLENRLRSFNLFDALKLSRFEIRHSDFLAYLLNPQDNHGLSDRFLKAFLQVAIQETDSLITRIDVSPIDIDFWNLSEAVVRREWKNTDILILHEPVKLAVLIENKLESSEHDDQLKRYYEDVQHECKGWNIVPIYLTPEGDHPSDKRYIALGYGAVCDVLTELVPLLEGHLHNDIRIVVEHYAEMLRRHVVSQSDISQLCQKIYSTHKQALDLIFEHLPDRQQLLRDTLVPLIKSSGFKFDETSSKSSIIFVPEKLDTDLLRQGEGRGGAGSGKSGRVLTFYVENLKESLTIKLSIGPGADAVRDKLFKLAHAHKRIFSPWNKLEYKWNQIYAYPLVQKNELGVLSEKELKVKVQEKWKDFADNQMPTILTAFENETWIGVPFGELESLAKSQATS